MKDLQEHRKDYLNQFKERPYGRNLLKSEDVLVKRSKNTVPINLEIAVPSKNIYRRNVQEGKIKIWNQDELYSVINLKIVNSRYQ